MTFICHSEGIPKLSHGKFCQLLVNASRDSSERGCASCAPANAPLWRTPPKYTSPMFCTSKMYFSMGGFRTAVSAPFGLFGVHLQFCFQSLLLCEGTSPFLNPGHEVWQCYKSTDDLRMPPVMRSQACIYVWVAEPPRVPDWGIVMMGGIY